MIIQTIQVTHKQANLVYLLLIVQKVYLKSNSEFELPTTAVTPVEAVDRLILVAKADKSLDVTSVLAT